MTDWHGTYDGNWRGLIVDEAFAHPAKFAKGLIERIILHGLERGYWRKGDLIGDPFGGIGTGGIIAAYNGLRWIGVELEPRFVELAQRNFALHRAAWKACGDPEPVLIQGDSRNFAALVGQCAAAVTSPPYAETIAIRSGPSGLMGGTFRLGRGDMQANAEGYGQSPGQIGSLRSGDVEAVITSPPYAESIQGIGEPVEKTRARMVARGDDPRSIQKVSKYCNDACSDYGQSPGQIGALKSGSVDSIISPPYAEGMGHGGASTGGSDGQRDRNLDAMQGGYGASEGQIGALREGCIDACVTSPPWENQEPSQADQKWHQARDSIGANNTLGVGHYGASPGQIGNASGETYWQAMDAVYRQVFIALKPGGVACIVLKDYVSKGKRVPLCDQSMRLLEHIGFVPVERIRAWLVKETVEAGLFGEHRKTTERKSFFRRLAEKNGSPRIDWEEVLIMRKPTESSP